jgi:hypothetical protein
VSISDRCVNPCPQVVKEALEDRTSWELIEILNTDGWEWKVLPKVREDYVVGGPKIWYTSGPTSNVYYLRALVSAPQLLEKGIRLLTFLLSSCSGVCLRMLWVATSFQVLVGRKFLLGKFLQIGPAFPPGVIHKLNEMRTPKVSSPGVASIPHGKYPSVYLELLTGKKKKRNGRQR